MNMRNWRRSYRNAEKRRIANLPKNLLEIEQVGRRSVHWLFSVHYPWNHPHCHFKNTITLLGDGFPIIRLRQLSKRFARFKVLQYRFPLMADLTKKRREPSKTAVRFMKFLKDNGSSYLDFPKEDLIEFFQQGGLGNGC